MKKLFIAAAMLAASLLTVNASVTETATGCLYVFDDQATMSLSVPSTTAYLDATNTVLSVVAGQAFSGAITPYESASAALFGLTWAYDGSSQTSDKAAWKFGSTYIQADGSARDMSFTGAAGLKIQIHAASKGSTVNEFELTGCTDDDATITFPAKDTEYHWVTKTYTMTDATATLSVSAGGFRIDSAYVGVSAYWADAKGAIASELLKKVGNDLINPTNLEVEVYTVMGVKVLTSSEATIDVAGLASGVYVAKTEEGTLKFIK